MRQDWETYQSRLKHYGYTEEQISAVKEIRETLDHCPFEMYKELITQGAIKRTIKLKKPRNIFTDGEKFYFLSHWHKEYRYCAFFPNETEE